MQRHDAVATRAYHARVLWEGNLGRATSSYSSYSRDYRILVTGKPDLAGSADPAYRGDPARHNPEDLFLASISGCHMLTYLALCARHGVHVVHYEDEVTGTLVVQADGGGQFTDVTIAPEVSVAATTTIT